ncbi:uncharacterized protein [Coffea arabica]|uniref:Uncharacterized protein n=1 Tax=Coffea arabica TaxID=13443 RepID=A0ABM4WPW3_COFAR
MEEFNEVMFNCALSNVDFDGAQFTWTNGTVWQRLDRALTNVAWNEVFGCSKVSHLSRGRSDHAPLLIQYGDVTATAPSFRFLNVWRNHSEFLPVVRKVWQTPVSATGMRRFFFKLCNTKAKLRQWNRDSFGYISQTIRDAEDFLQPRELEYDNARDEITKARLGEARAAHTHALAIECDYWRQKASIKWIQSGDGNTKFFHSVVRK